MHKPGTRRQKSGTLNLIRLPIAREPETRCYQLETVGAASRRDIETIRGAFLRGDAAPTADFLHNGFLIGGIGHKP